MYFIREGSEDYIMEEGAEEDIELKEDKEKSIKVKETAKKTVKRAPYSGWCSVCGNFVDFADMAPSIRETYQCLVCRASMRERILAEAILFVFAKGAFNNLNALIQSNELDDLKIYEPGVSGAYRKYFAGLLHYTNSWFYDSKDAEPGEDMPPHQDIMSLTFSDDLFDLVITSDIFEHIRKPWTAFSEIYRVLKPDGQHIFSIPALAPMPASSVARVDTSGHEDTHVLPPRYHGNGKGGRSLVYTDFGADLFSELNHLGFLTFAIRCDHVDQERARVITFISTKIP